MNKYKCTKCGKKKELNSLNFYEAPTKHGYQPRCKECELNDKKKYWKKKGKAILKRRKITSKTGELR